MECTKCGASSEFIKLHDVISGEGIVKLCSRCLSDDRVPVINKPTESQLQSVHKSTSLYKRLSEAAGIDPDQHRQNVSDFQNKEVKAKEEVSLRQLVDKKYDKIGMKQEVPKKREDLIDNFHWVIMRARRNRKLSISQLAKELRESERVLKMAEQGVLPERDYVLIQKIETALGITLLRPEVAEELERQKKQLGFDKHSSEALTISDLQEMKKDKVPGVQKEPYWRRLISKFTSKEDIPQEDIAQVMNQEEERKEFADDGVDTFEFEGNSQEVEFDDTSLEISKEIAEEPKEDPKKELTQKEIDDLIFGRG